VIHQRTTTVWVERCRAQIAGVLDILEADRAARPGAWWFGERIGHADVAVGCVLRFVGEAHPEVLAGTRWPALAAHAARCEHQPEFQAVTQPFHVTPPQG